MDLSVIIKLAAENLAAAQQVQAALGSIEAQGLGANSSLGDVSKTSSDTDAALKAVSSSTIDVSARLAEARVSSDSFKDSLISQGVATKVADDAAKGLTTTLASNLVFQDLAQSATDAGMALETVSPALKSTANDMVTAQVNSETTADDMNVLQSALMNLNNTFSSSNSHLGAFPNLLIMGAVAAAPLIFALSSVAIVLATFTAGLIAAMAVMAIGFGGLALLAGGFTFLAVSMGHTAATAQQVQQAQSNLTSAQASAESAQNSYNSAVKANGASSSQAEIALQRLQVAQSNVTSAQKTLNSTLASQKEGTSPAILAFKQLQEAYKGVATSLALMSQGPAAEIINFLTTLAPMIEQTGQDLVTWFGPRVTPLINALGVGFEILQNTLVNLGNVVGPFFDQVLSETPQFSALLVDMSNIGVSAVSGLLTNLLNLSNWFMQELPVFGPIVSQIFGGVGTILQNVGQAFGQISLQVIANWPQVVKTFQEVGDVLGPVLKTIGGLGDFALQHLSVVTPIVLGLVGALVILKTTVAAVQAGQAIYNAYLVIAKVATSAWTVAQAVFNGVMALDPITLIIIGIIVLIAIIILVITHWKEFTAALQVAWTWFTNVASVVEDFIKTHWPLFAAGLIIVLGPVGALIDLIILTVTHFNQLKTTVENVMSSMGSAIGGAFSQIGTFIHNGLKDARTVLVDFIKMVDNIPVIGGAISGAGLTPSSVPAFAQGGYVSQPTLAVVGEGGGGEYMIPTGAGAGSRAVELWKKAGEALGMGANMTVGSIGGQCLQWVSDVTGLFYGIPMASGLAPYINSASATPGEVFVSMIPPYGHTGFVLGTGPSASVEDSNWVAPLTIGIHKLSDIPDIAGYINLGKSVSGLASATSATGIFDIPALVKGVVTSALGGLGGWEGAVAKGVVNISADTLIKKFDRGGSLPRGASIAVNGTGAAESVLGPPAEQKLTTINQLLTSIDKTLRLISGQSPAGSNEAQKAYGG
jgi:hypothetical protein